MNIIVSNTTKEHQMINLLTDLKQATSRQRNKSNPNYNRFIYIFNQNNFDKSESELLQIVEDSKKQIADNCQLLNELQENEDNRYSTTLKTFQESRLFNAYSTYKDNKFIINELAFNADQYFILETRRQFVKGFEIMGLLPVNPIEIDAPRVTSQFSYSSLLNKYKESLTNPDVSFTDDERATENYQLIDRYYKEYGKLTTNSSYAKKMIKASGNDLLKTYHQVRNTLQIKRYPLKEIKEILTNIYKQYGVERKAKETDLNEFGIRYTKTKIKGFYHITINGYI